MSRPRVLFVDDDASIRAMVDMALEELPIELIICDGVAAAQVQLRQAPARLIITDLMMPGATGIDLLQWLQQHPACRGDALQVVFSAGLSATAREQLASLDVWRLLNKPVSISKLIDCVSDALALHSAAPVPAAVDAPGQNPSDDADTQALQAHFGGNLQLYQGFKASCLQQFVLDIAQGDKAQLDGDTDVVLHLAHSLKSVLLLLGQTEASAVARSLEHSASSADWPGIQAQWPQLRQRLTALIDNRVNGDSR
jgi:CheY-like chemotaxis protein